MISFKGLSLKHVSCVCQQRNRISRKSVEKSYDEKLKIAKKLHNQVGQKLQKLLKSSRIKHGEIFKLLVAIEKTAKCVKNIKRQVCNQLWDLLY